MLIKNMGAYDIKERRRGDADTSENTTIVSELRYYLRPR